MDMSRHWQKAAAFQKLRDFLARRRSHRSLRARGSAHAPQSPYRTMFSEQAAPWYDAEAPQAGIVIVNRDDPDLTKKCLDQVWLHTSGYSYEVVLVDNGSSDQSFADLTPIDGPCTLVRLNKSRSLGEANNIGVERSRAPVLIFLGNDVMVTQGWLAPLLDVLREVPGAGAVGPRLARPDGQVAAAGFFIDAAGELHQASQESKFDHESATDAPIVDYVPSTCLAVSRTAFEAAGGFDLLFEATPFEDIDLCLKLRLLGKTVHVCSRSTVLRTTETRRQDDENADGSSRQNFADRWGAWLDAREKGDDEAVRRSLLANLSARQPTTKQKPQGRSAVVFVTPHDLVPGGGERYILAAASALAKSFDVYVASKEPYSNVRLVHLERELGLDLSNVALITQAQIPALQRVEHCFVLGNELVPDRPGMARKNTYICQFPKPVAPDDLAARRRNLESFDKVIVYSHFVQEHVERGLAAAKLPRLPIEIVYPPVRLIASDAAIKRSEPPFKIILIGRFFAGHSKRHDVAIQAFGKLCERGARAELHLIGSVPYRLLHSPRLARLQQAAAGLPVSFHINAPRNLVDRLISEASLYWHAAGFDVDPNQHPEQCEHFGISILEAMSGGCVPLVCDNGGPTEFITEGKSGFFYVTIDELVEKSERVLSDQALFRKLSEEARQRALDFSDPAFASRWGGLVELTAATSGDRIEALVLCW